MAEFDGLHADLTERVIAVFYQVNNELGQGFFESVYQRAMLIALCQAGLTAEAEVAIPVWFRGQSVGVFSADIVVEKSLILELKVADEVAKAAQGQLGHYLWASKFELGLVLAFGSKGRFARVLVSNDRKRSLRA